MNREKIIQILSEYAVDLFAHGLRYGYETNTPLLEKIADEIVSSLPPAEGAETNRQIQQLREFHTAFKLPQRDIPTIIPPDEFKLRHKILVEEVGELSDAYFVDDIVEVADAITDCLYVLIGTAIQFGIADKLEACFDEVHRSNMSKLGSDGYPIMREDGKVMKGENYTRPDLQKILSEPSAAQQQPTAEGAEEILESIVESLGDPIYIHNHVFEIRPYTVEHKTEWWIFHKEVGSGEPLAQWLNKFATLHAQRIADKMVEEKAVGFADWLSKLQPSQKVSVWSKNGEHSGLFTMDNEQLYKKYLKSIEP